MKPPAIRFTLSLLALLAGGYVLGALGAQLALVFDPEASGLLLDRGPGKLMRRVAMIVVVLSVPLLLRRHAWGGWRDNGLWLEGAATPWRQDFVRGTLAGVISLGLLSLVASLMGERVVRVELAWGWVPVAALGFAARGALVGVLEEILARGILFRSLARLWPVGAAALFSSGLFAVGHFLKPQDAAFAEGWVLPPVLSMGEHLAGIAFIELRLVNMVLMSLVLCLAVYRLKTVWLAAGLHAGWVFAKGLTDHLVVWNPDRDYGWLWGRRSDYTDSLLCLVMLLLVAAWVARMPVRDGVAVGDAP